LKTSLKEKNLSFHELKCSKYKARSKKITHKKSFLVCYERDISIYKKTKEFLIAPHEELCTSKGKVSEVYILVAFLGHQGL
jgi:hypothetical protein